jgi:hypothetical protein
MVATPVQLKRALQNLQRDDLLDIGLTNEQWNIFEEVERLSRPFMQVQKALEGEKHVTLSLVPFLLASLRANQQAVAAPEGAVKKIAAAMLTLFNRHCVC